VIYSLPQHDSDCLLVTAETAKHLVVTLQHGGTVLDRFLYDRKGSCVKVKGSYSQDTVGACQHASDYWFVRPSYYKERKHD
jgi:hypothetical protein